jgi:hypothetical protein
MKFKKTHILLLLFSSLFWFSEIQFALSSVFIGGEITWECLGNGRYRFHMKLYKECAETTLNYRNIETLQITNYPSAGQVTNIKMGLISSTDDSPLCNAGGPAITCAGAFQAESGAVAEYLYNSDAENPTGILLTGVPPKQGWIFTYKSPTVAGVTWKRSKSTNIVNSDVLTWGLRAIVSI